MEIGKKGQINSNDNIKSIQFDKRAWRLCRFLRLKITPKRLIGESKMTGRKAIIRPIPSPLEITINKAKRTNCITRML